MPRPWRSTGGSMSTRPAYSGTGRSTPPCWTPWTSSTCAWPRPAPCSSTTLSYETVSTVTDPEGSPRQILSQLLAHQESHRRAELEARQCLSGPHKDDLTVELDGVSAKAFASQGQTRTAALSLKLASREIFFGLPGDLLPRDRGVARPPAGRRALRAGSAAAGVRPPAHHRRAGVHHLLRGRGAEPPGGGEDLPHPGRTAGFLAFCPMR